MISDGNEPKSNLDRFDETNNFYVERFLIRGHLEGQIGRTKQAILALPIRQGVWWGAPVFASWQGRIQMALTFAYELGLERVLYRNRPFRRDEDNMCRNFSHMRPSWGRNQPNSVLNTKSEYFEHNFGLRDETGWLWPKYQSFSFRHYGTLSLWALLHLRPS